MGIRTFFPRVMKIIYAEEFRKRFQKLPKRTAYIYIRQEKIFRENWRDPRLHVKKLRGSVAFSFRITRNYRVLFTFVATDTALLATIGDRKDVYKHKR